jgi:hypothetical protein
MPAAIDLPGGRQFLPIFISRYLDSPMASYGKKQPIVDKFGLRLRIRGEGGGYLQLFSGY